MKSFAAIAGDFANKPSSQDNKTGYSCLGFCAALYKKMGKDWPEVWNGLTIDNYQDTIKTRSPEAREKLLELAVTIGKEINPKDIVAGDFVIVKANTGDLFPAVCAGNGNIIASFRHSGIKTLPLGEQGEVLIARRL